MSFNVNLMAKVNGEIISKPVFTNMEESEAKRIAHKMNKHNILAAKMLGKVFKSVFQAVNNG